MYSDVKRGKGGASARPPQRRARAGLQLLKAAPPCHRREVPCPAAQPCGILAEPAAYSPHLQYVHRLRQQQRGGEGGLRQLALDGLAGAGVERALLRGGRAGGAWRRWVHLLSASHRSLHGAAAGGNAVSPMLPSGTLERHRQAPRHMRGMHAHKTAPQQASHSCRSPQRPSPLLPRGPPPAASPSARPPTSLA